MKILFIVDDFPVISETFILDQITGLIDRGHAVDILAKGQGIQSKTHKEVEKYNLLEHTSYYQPLNKYMPTEKLPRLVQGFYHIVTNLHKKPMALLKSLNIIKFKRDAASLRTLYKVIPFLDKGPYDIIHCHFGPNGNLGLYLRDIGALGGKIITTFHGYDISYYIKQHGEEVYDQLFSKGDLFLPISEHWKNKLIRLGCSEQKIVVHRMGIDTNKFCFSPRSQQRNDRLQLLTVARLVEKKGIKYGIEAVSKVTQNYGGIQYKIVGDGPLKSQLESLIKQLNISSNIKLLGWQKHEEVVKLMEEADILLAPSVTSKDGDQEGIPVVLMEALAKGLPVVSTYHSGIPELVQDGRTGFLVPERDIGALADRLIYLIMHPEKCLEMGRAGRKYVTKYYDINTLNDQLVDIYQQLLD